MRTVESSKGTDMRYKSSAIGAFVALGVLALASGCGGGGSSESSPTASPTVPATIPPDPQDTLDESVHSLEEAHSFVMHISSTASQAGSAPTTFEIVAGYELRKVAYSHMTVLASAGSSAALEYLLLPPDLYLRVSGDDQWYVQSPWNQGIKASELPDPDSEDPVNTYETLIDDAFDLEFTDSERIDGVTYLRIHRGYHPSGTFDAWIDEKSHRPFRIALRGEVEQSLVLEINSAFTETIDFTAYDEPLVPPDPPSDVRPVRDLDLPAAPCTGDTFEECTAAQAELASSASPDCSGTGRRVCLVPLGTVDPEIVDGIVTDVQTEYGLTVTVLTPLSVPAEMADPLREQVDGGALIEYMVEQVGGSVRDPDVVLIGLSPLDIYDKTGTLRYVFGMKGDASDPLGVISTFRMDPQTYGEAPDRQVTLDRTRKMFTKYLGVLYYDIPPSEDPQSAMYNHINGREDLDNMTEPLEVPR